MYNLIEQNVNNIFQTHSYSKQILGRSSCKNCKSLPRVINMTKLLKNFSGKLHDIPRKPASVQCFPTPQFCVFEEFCQVFFSVFEEFWEVKFFQKIKKLYGSQYLWNTIFCIRDTFSTVNVFFIWKVLKRTVHLVRIEPRHRYWSRAL